MPLTSATPALQGDRLRRHVRHLRGNVHSAQVMDTRRLAYCCLRVKVGKPGHALLRTVKRCGEMELIMQTGQVAELQELCGELDGVRHSPKHLARLPNAWHER